MEHCTLPLQNNACVPIDEPRLTHQKQTQQIFSDINDSRTQSQSKIHTASENNFVEMEV